MFKLLEDLIKKYWLSLLVILVLIVSGIGYVYLEQKRISFILFIAGILGIIISLWQLHQGRKIKEEYDIINDYKRKYEEQLNNVKKLIGEREKVTFEKSELKKFLDKINETLQKENISKEELIKNISSSLKAIIFFKTSEDTSKKRALFLNHVYPNMGIISIRSGLSILPPKRVPQNLSNTKILEWFKKELEKRIPKDYEYNIPLISVINLNETKSFKRLESFRKIQFSYLDNIPIEEIAPAQEIINYLQKKKNLSPKDIIEMPNILFLVEDYFIKRTDLEILRRDNDKILDAIKKAIKSEEIKTTDLATVEEGLLSDILKKYVSEPEKIAKRIKDNAIFWKSYFEHRLKPIFGISLKRQTGNCN